MALAAKAATITIPVVFALGSDPVEDGLVASFNRPGGNITGVTFFTNQLIAKRLELLREIVPKPAMVSVFVNPKNANAKRDIRDIEAAARSLGQPVEILRAGTPDEIDLAFASFPGDGSGALLVTADAFFSTRREQFALLSARYSVPAIFGQREFVTAGGLASYGSNVADSHRQAGIYVGRILKGVKPTDLPVMQPTRSI